MKTLLLFTSLTIFSIAASAQFTGAGISARAGLSYISLKLPTIINTVTQSDPLFCFQSGVFTEYKLNNRIHLLAELNFLLQQGKITENSVNCVLDTGSSHCVDILRTRLDYLSLPIWFGYNIHHFTVKGGIQAGYVVRRHLFENGTAYGTDTTFSFSNTFTNKIVKNFDFGICIGAQEDISNRFFLSMSAYQSLTNIIYDNSFGGIRKNS
ncbi:MAG: porin family protein, partial [Chitinophagales bacterium]